MRFAIVLRCLPVLLAAAVALPTLAQQPAPAAGAAPHEEFKNLKVLPKDIPPAELRATMNAFTRALGVRCAYCHVGVEGKPMKAEDFQLDDKPTKLKARTMLEMVRDINGKYLANLDHRAEPAIHVECFTCHHGTTQPRTLQAVLENAYQNGGMDSTVARYRALRSRYYGRAAYDFGEVPLADVGESLLASGHAADAESLLALNVAVNPGSAFAVRQLSVATITQAFIGGAAQGAAAVADLRGRYGDTFISEEMINGIGYDLLGRHEDAGALAAFRQNVADHGTSANVYDSLGEALAQTGDRKGAIAAYEHELQIDPANKNATQRLEALKHPAKAGKPGAH